MSILARASSLASFSSVMDPLRYRHKKGDASSDECVSLCNCEQPSPRHGLTRPVGKTFIFGMSDSSENTTLLNLALCASDL
jgi:hypothetical protein